MAWDLFASPGVIKQLDGSAFGGDNLMTEQPLVDGSRPFEHGRIGTRVLCETVVASIVGIDYDAHLGRPLAKLRDKAVGVHVVSERQPAVDDQSVDHFPEIGLFVGSHSVPASFFGASASRLGVWTHDLRPSDSFADARYGAGREVEVGCDSRESIATLPSLTDRQHVGFRESGKPVRLAAGDQFGLTARPVVVSVMSRLGMEARPVSVAGSPSASLPHVVHVVEMGSQFKVVRSDAVANVAAMSNQESVWDWAVDEFPHNAMGGSRPSGDLDYGVPAASGGSVEQPAALTLDDFGPETVRPWKATVPHASHFSSANCQQQYSRNALAGLH